MHEPSEAPPEGSGDKKFKVVYTIVERGGDKRAVWVRIGAAFVNRDQSINVKLDAVPVSGTLHIRDYVPDEEYRGRRANDNNNNNNNDNNNNSNNNNNNAPYRAQHGG